MGLKRLTGPASLLCEQAEHTGAYQESWDHDLLTALFGFAISPSSVEISKGSAVLQ